MSDAARANGNADDTPHSCRELKIAIGDIVGKDLRERLDSIGNSAAAVHLRKETLQGIAFRIPNRRGDARSPLQMTVDELRAYIAKNLGKEPVTYSFRWEHLNAIYEEISADGGDEQ